MFQLSISAMEQHCSGRLLILHCPDDFYMLQKHAYASGSHPASVRWLSEASQTNLKPPSWVREATAGTRTVRRPWGGQWRHRRHTSHENERVKLQQLLSRSYGPQPTARSDGRPPRDGGTRPRARGQPPCSTHSMDCNAATCYEEQSTSYSALA
jgi:hypothetical protein